MKNMVLAGLLCVFLLGMGFQAFGQANPNMPPWVREEPPADALWGIAFANLPDSRHAMNIAEIRARMSLAAQIFSELKLFGAAYKGIDSGARLFVLQCVDLDFSFEIINDTRVLRQWQAPDGTVWCQVEIRKSNINKYRGICERIYNDWYQVYLEEKE